MKKENIWTITPYSKHLGATGQEETNFFPLRKKIIIKELEFLGRIKKTMKSPC